jgi:hypothetical protein
MKAALNEVEQETQQLKIILLIHSQNSAKHFVEYARIMLVDGAEWAAWDLQPLPIQLWHSSKVEPEKS